MIALTQSEVTSIIVHVIAALVPLLFGIIVLLLLRDWQTTATMRKLAEKIDALDHDFREQMITLHRSLGLVEGQVETLVE